MLIRYQMAYYQPAKNSLNRTCSIHNNYQGVVIGVSEQVITVYNTTNTCQRSQDKIKLELQLDLQFPICCLL